MTSPEGDPIDRPPELGLVVDPVRKVLEPGSFPLASRPRESPRRKGRDHHRRHTGIGPSVKKTLAELKVAIQRVVGYDSELS